MPFFPFGFHNLTKQDHNPPPFPLQFNLRSLLSSAQASTHAILSHVCPVDPIPSSTSFPSVFARIPEDAAFPSIFSIRNNLSGILRYKEGTTANRLEKIPVYALRNADDNIVSPPDAAGRSLGLIFFKKEDAEAMLQTMRGVDKKMKPGELRVVQLSWNMVFRLKVVGITVRFVPDSSQLVTALKETENAGEYTEGGFKGVPVFQSRTLFVNSKNKKCRPIFFKKEDLDDFARASNEKRPLESALRGGDIQWYLIANSLTLASIDDRRGSIGVDFIMPNEEEDCNGIMFITAGETHLIRINNTSIQVGVLEEILKTMMDSNTTKLDDVVFVPPGVKMSPYEN